MVTFENSSEGAKESRSIIKQFHACLNNPDIIPDQAYRRNVLTYPLVCYINCIIGAFLSKNYPIIPLFINRAARHMEQFPPSPVAAKYYEFAFSYLAQVTYHVRSFVNLDAEAMELLPQKIVDAGKQSAPSWDLEK